MQTALDVFRNGMQRTRALHALHGSFLGQVTAAIDLTDILRAEVVLAVSALDYFVHELTRMGMIECWSGGRIQTGAFLRYQLPLSAVPGLGSPGTAQQTFDSEIRAKHSFLSFQHPDKIADAIRLFSPVNLWERVGLEMARPAQNIKTSLILIIDRRNKIAHEADADPSYPGQRWPIDRAMVEGIFDEIEMIVSSIYKVVV
jgi:hypothetical protein